VEGVNIHAAIAAQADLLAGFGGHPMAAGLSIEAERIPEFRRRLWREVEKMQGVDLPEATLQIDGYLPLAELTPDLVADLERLAPFGAGNPPLTLACRNLRLERAEPLGRNGEHLLLIVEDETGSPFRIVWWQGAGWALPEGVFDLAYTARASSYRGRDELQIEWLDARQQAEAPTELARLHPPLEVIDYRGEAHPLPILRRLQAEGEVQVWREADAGEHLEGRDRYHLTPSSALAIWTTPPGPLELSLALELASPQRVYLFGIAPEAGQPEVFLQRLVGLLKYALRARQGRVGIADLAAATGQREATVQAGLAWLQARGHIRLQAEQDGEVILAAGDSLVNDSLPERASRLRTLLEESAAYRAYFARADKDSLLNAPPSAPSS
jgi:single-stranded-DNA-specific exonuclease